MITNPNIKPLIKNCNLLISEEDVLMLGIYCVDYEYLSIESLTKIKEYAEKSLTYYANNGISEQNIIDINNDIYYNFLDRINRAIPKKIKVKKDKVTNLYVMIDHHTGYYKIGKSKNPLDRERTLQSEKPTIELINTISYNEKNIDLESYFHNMFKETRVRGEWFRLNEEELDYIKNYKHGTA